MIKPPLQLNPAAMSHDFAESCNWTGEVIKKVRVFQCQPLLLALRQCAQRCKSFGPSLTASLPTPLSFALQAFKTQAGNTWSKRTLEFSGTEFKLTWKKNGVAKDTFVLNPLEVDFGPCEEHHRPFEIKVTSPRDGNKMSLYFCPETADDQNVLITRMDAARRLKVASVSTSGTVFSDERSTLQMALTSPAGPESGAKAFSWGLGSLDRKSVV